MPEHDQRMKMLFTVEVYELRPTTCDDTSRGSADDISLDAAFRSEWTSVSVSLGPQRHTHYAWVTEGEVREFIDSGLFPVEETKQYEMMLNAFAFHRQCLKHMAFGEELACQPKQTRVVHRETTSPDTPYRLPIV